MEIVAGGGILAPAETRARRDGVPTASAKDASRSREPPSRSRRRERDRIVGTAAKAALRLGGESPSLRMSLRRRPARARPESAAPAVAPSTVAHAAVRPGEVSVATMTRVAERLLGRAHDEATFARRGAPGSFRRRSIRENEERTRFSQDVVIRPSRARHLPLCATRWRITTNRRSGTHSSTRDSGPSARGPSSISRPRSLRRSDRRPRLRRRRAHEQSA